MTFSFYLISPQIFTAVCKVIPHLKEEYISCQKIQISSSRNPLLLTRTFHSEPNLHNVCIGFQAKSGFFLNEAWSLGRVQISFFQTFLGVSARGGLHENAIK